MKFKVGDRLKRIYGEHAGMSVDCEDIVTDITNGGVIYFKGYAYGHNSANFELVKDKNIIKNGNTKGKGHRYNKDKPRVELLVPEAMEETAKVWAYGANKYTPNNWRKGLSILSIVGCVMRHTLSILKGEDTDKETGLLHAAHIICNCQMLIYFYKTNQYGKLDDRYKGEPDEI